MTHLRMSRAASLAVLLVMGFASAAGQEKQQGASGPTFTRSGDGWWYVNKKSLNDAPPPEADKPQASVVDFWPQNVRTGPQGVLITQDGIPVRVLASGYVTPLFESQSTEFPRGVVDIMKPFTPYYVIAKTGPALLVAERPNAPQAQTYWVRQGDCYAWATGLTAVVPGTVSLYGSAQQARTGGQALSPVDKYVDVSKLRYHPAGAGDSQPLARLPVLFRSNELGAFLSPAGGGKLCWLNMRDAGSSVTWMPE
jgi:hypothetical protein